MTWDKIEVESDGLAWETDVLGPVVLKGKHKIWRWNPTLVNRLREAIWVRLNHPCEPADPSLQHACYVIAGSLAVEARSQLSL